jgi:hypothetical protein
MTIDWREVASVAARALQLGAYGLMGVSIVYWVSAASAVQWTTSKPPNTNITEAKYTQIFGYHDSWCDCLNWKDYNRGLNGAASLPCVAASTEGIFHFGTPWYNYAQKFAMLASLAALAEVGLFRGLTRRHSVIRTLFWLGQLALGGISNYYMVGLVVLLYTYWTSICEGKNWKDYGVVPDWEFYMAHIVAAISCSFTLFGAYNVLVKKRSCNGIMALLGPVQVLQGCWASETSSYFFVPDVPRVQAAIPGYLGEKMGLWMACTCTPYQCWEGQAFVSLIGMNTMRAAAILTALAMFACNYDAARSKDGVIRKYGVLLLGAAVFAITLALWGFNAFYERTGFGLSDCPAADQSMDKARIGWAWYLMGFPGAMYFSFAALLFGLGQTIADWGTR